MNKKTTDKSQTEKEITNKKLTWPKLIVLAVIAGVWTALMTIIPALKYTSFHTIAVSLEVWILFGILIIMNSSSNKDAALKCFVFFLISQPLIYLLQVPFSWQGWGLFRYYDFWFKWTIFTLPMGYIGYYIKKDKWWGYLILLPMILLVAYSYNTYLNYFLFSYPKYLLICLFCIFTMIFYPLWIFKNKKIRYVGVSISVIIILVITILIILNPYTYSTSILSVGEEEGMDNTYKIYFKDKKYGDLKIVYDNGLEGYLVKADLKKEGKAEFVLESPSGEKHEYIINIKLDTYKIKKVK